MPVVLSAATLTVTLPDGRWRHAGSGFHPRCSRVHLTWGPPTHPATPEAHQWRLHGAPRPAKRAASGGRPRPRSVVGVVHAKHCSGRPRMLGRPAAAAGFCKAAAHGRCRVEGTSPPCCTPKARPRRPVDPCLWDEPLLMMVAVATLQGCSRLPLPVGGVLLPCAPAAGQVCAVSTPLSIAAGAVSLQGSVSIAAAIVEPEGPHSGGRGAGRLGARLRRARRYGHKAKMPQGKDAMCWRDGGADAARCKAARGALGLPRRSAACPCMPSPALLSPRRWWNQGGMCHAQPQPSCKGLGVGRRIPARPLFKRRAAPPAPPQPGRSALGQKRIAAPRGLRAARLRVPYIRACAL